MQRHGLFSRLERVFWRLGISLLICAGSIAAPAQENASPANDARALEIGKPFERELSGKNVDHYTIAMQAGEYAAIDVEQRGLDVVVEILDPAGKNFVDFDYQIRPLGKESAFLVAESPGTYRVDIRPRYSRAPAGRYQIQLAQVRAAEEKDRQIFQAYQLTSQGQKLNEVAKYPDARKLAAQALEVGEKVLAPNDPFLGVLLARSADQERIAENRPKSAELFQRAIALDDATVGHEDPQTAFALMRMGVLYNWADNYVKAEPPLTESVTIFEKTLGPEHPRVIDALTALAGLHQNRHDFQKTSQELLRSQAIAEKALEPDDFMTILVINNLGNLYREMHDYDRAEPMIERVVQMIENKYGPNYPRLATPLTNLGVMARKKGQYQRSLDYLLRAEAIQEKAYGTQNTGLARVLITIGNTYRAENEYTKALETYDRAREILKQSAGPYDVLMLLTYVNAATAYEAIGDLPDAVGAQTRVESIMEESIKLNMAIGSERQKLDYLTDAWDQTERTISLNASLGAQDEKATDLAALVLLQRKGRVLDEMSGDMAMLRKRLSPQDQTLLDELNKTTEEMARLALDGPGKTPPQEYQKHLADLQTQREDLEAKVSRTNSEFRIRAQSVTLAAVQNAIPPHAALVEFATYHPFNPKLAEEENAESDPHYIAYVMRENGEPQWKDLGLAKTIDDAVATFRKALRDPESKTVQRAARSLDAMVMQPVRTLSGDATQLLISPDGQLNLIPFEALVDEHSHFLVEKYSISYLSTGRDLLRMGTSRLSKSGPVIVADPFFGERTSATVASAKAVSARMARRSVTTGGDLASMYFTPLEGTAVEATTIKALFPESKLLTGRRATQSAVMQLEAPSILHIATHGFFLTNFVKDADHEMKETRGIQEASAVDNPLLRSGLALAGANRRNGNSKDDGILTALEASNMNLWGTKLVTLSACDTGVGDVRDGEGVYGLRRSFVLAGAESVVMSLWPVSDYVTRELMTSYYARLKKGLGRGEALRQTKLAMLKKQSRRHPFYWASFIQSGEWANLDGKREANVAVPASVSAKAN